MCAVFAAVCFTGSASAQDRDRVVKTISSQPTNLPPTAAAPQPEKVKLIPTSRPTLTTDIVVIKQSPALGPSLVKKTVSSLPTNASSAMAANRMAYGMPTSILLDQAIKERYGLPYHYGSTGPNAYDCSGFVWSVFQKAGIDFERSSARSLWSESEPVDGDDRFKFGTLVFFNGLGHIGIVADENGFYHASTSHGIIYSAFKGYWENRIVGFRRLKPAIPAQQQPTVQPPK